MDPPLQQQQQQQQVTANAPFGPRNATSIRSKLMDFDRQIDGVQQKINSKQQQIRSKEEGEIRSKEEEIRSKEEEIYPKEGEIRSKEEEIRSKEEEIYPKEEEIRSKEEEIRSKQQQLDQFEQQTTEESNQSLRQLLSLERERSSLIYKVRSLERERSSRKDELASLKDELASLKDERSSLIDQVRSLERELASLNGELASLINEQTMLGRSFTEGRYFAPLFDYWKVSAKNIVSNWYLRGIQWTNVWRTAEEADFIDVRRYNIQGILSLTRPYKDTRIGAKETNNPIAASDTSRTSQHSQNDKTLRNMVWPTDIFGNTPNTFQQISHLLPEGQTHKEWMHIAASVVGLDKDGAPDVWKKAVRGYINKETSTKRSPGSGVVHFVSNKIRMSNQAVFFDGDTPNAILIPTMSLESAKAWKGEAYGAIFAVGLPTEMGNNEGPGVPTLYVNAGLTSNKAMNNDGVRDASATEIETARTTLTHAVLAVRDYLRSIEAEDRMDKFDIIQTNRDAVTQSHVYANASSECLLPELDKEEKHRKPLCLVEFGSVGDEGKHPAPDPLLLAYKAAAIWGMTTGRRLLSNGEFQDPSDDISEGDYLAELAFLEARSGFKRPKTWEDLAIGLGQPNGYQASLTRNHNDTMNTHQ
ncbi:hypothetical protein IV203_006386 [Nitzschia inconspicua]|uniref:Uncharacterized protein n=1 Tax=Nitzschia inconspicua TaxID=303405 RepID=A0A9K3P7C5_9STRA|nr:hypothetical protein IV203_006589 [Nitzschia inconspicua]KAG7339983.1 hypothetical protein IV203_006386 [Nitzschia inconspicua]